jgi:hypothetical protein
MRYKSTWYPFTEHPNSDSCWSLSVGPDGRIYAAACSEYSPGQTVKLVRYNDETDSLDSLFDLDEVVDDPRDSGRATQCKIHYSFAPSMSDGILYMATHVSGPPIDRPAYSPWSSWHDPERCFRGAALVAFDTRTDEVLWWDTLIPKEGSRCMAHDEDNGLIYSTSFPRDHLFVYDLRARKRRDLGRIGSVNSQAMFIDSRHRVWTASDYGRLVRYDPEKDRLEISPSVLPHNPVFQTGWHSVFYDVVAAPDAPCVYATMWIAQPRLLRIWPEEGEWGRVEDLGPLTQECDTSIPYDTFLDHCGGLTFAADGQLYFVASRWKHENYDQAPLHEKNDDTKGVVWRLDPDTLEREEVAVLERPDASAHYVSRGAVDRHGDLFFANVSKTPVGIFKLHMPEDRKRENAHLPIRMWG